MDWIEVFLIIGQILNTGAVVSLFIFIQRVAFTRIKQLEDKMEKYEKGSTENIQKLIDHEIIKVESNCELRHSRIDEYLKRGEEIMDDLVSSTQNIELGIMGLKGSISNMGEKIKSIEEQSKQRRSDDPQSKK